MSYETEKSLERVSSRESSAEKRETKEAEVNTELKQAAAMERADYLNKEIKTSKKQMQNIVLHIQQVTVALRQLREMLKLSDRGDAPSLLEDKKKVEELKEKISYYKDELVKMKDDLVKEQIEELKNNQTSGMSELELKIKAEEMVEGLIKSIDN